MTIRIYDAFSGNNSGTYALLGTFEKPEDARRLRDELAIVFAQHKAWIDVQQRNQAAAPTTPLHDLFAREGIPSKMEVGGGDDWQHYEGDPVVLADEHQLLVYASYAATFPRELGALVYQRGGRVAAEYVHAHDPIVLVHQVWMHEGWKQQDEADSRIAAFRRCIQYGELNALYRAEHDDGTPSRSAPILESSEWPPMLTLTHAPFDLAAGFARVAELAQLYGLKTRTQLFEAPGLGEDPLRVLARRDMPSDRYQVVLWEVGANLSGVQAAVRAATQCSIADAVELVHRAPIEVLKEATEANARALLHTLKELGAHAEMLGPHDFKQP